MNEVELLRELRADLQNAPAQKVLYLEGKTDVPIFFALLGLTPPRDGLHQGVLVKGLKDKSGQGSSAVRLRVDLAKKREIPQIYGLLDGDGRSLPDLSAHFDPPFAGPLFQWKAYCIENLLVRTGWPPTLGPDPDASSLLRELAPYAAINRLAVRIQSDLRELGLLSYQKPILDKPSKTIPEFVEILEAGAQRFETLDLVQVFQDEHRTIAQTIQDSEHEAHTHINGKWLVDILAARHARRHPDECRKAWLEHAITVGGLPEARDLWQRITTRHP